MFGYVFIAFASFAALQSCQAHSTKKNEVDAFTYSVSRGLLDEAQKFLADLLSKVTSVANAVVAKIGDELNKIKEIAQNQINAILPILEAVVTDAWKVIEELEKKALALGISATECTGSNKDTIAKLVNEAKDQIMVCVNKIVASADTLIDTANKEAQNAVKQVNALIQKLAGCGSLQITCYMGVIAEANTLFTTLREKLLDLAGNILREAANLESQLPECTTSTVNNALGNVANIVKTVSKCVTDLINGATPKRIGHF